MKQINCEHYKGDGFTYEMFNCELNLCAECEGMLRQEILEQIKLERKLNGKNE